VSTVWQQQRPAAKSHQSSRGVHSTCVLRPAAAASSAAAVIMPHGSSAAAESQCCRGAQLQLRPNARTSASLGCGLQWEVRGRVWSSASRSADGRGRLGRQATVVHEQRHATLSSMLHASGKATGMLQAKLPTCGSNVLRRCTAA